MHPFAIKHTPDQLVLSTHTKLTEIFLVLGSSQVGWTRKLMANKIHRIFPTTHCHFGGNTRIEYPIDYCLDLHFDERHHGLSPSTTAANLNIQTSWCGIQLQHPRVRTFPKESSIQVSGVSEYPMFG
jgi:enoyl reductase-like protein